MLLLRRPFRVALVAALAGTLTAACSGSKPNGVRPAEPNAATTATPTAAPADAKLAETLRHRGDYERAIDVYAALVRSDIGQQRQDALLAEAQLLGRIGRAAEARAALEQFLANAGPAGAASPAQFMLASTLDDLGDPQGALEDYDAYIAAGGAASEFAHIERAKMLARLGRTVEAEQAAEAVLASDLQPSFKASFTFSIASAFDQAGAYANALNWYNRVKITPSGDVADALARTGGIKKRLGDSTWVSDYLEEIARFPSSAVARDLLAELDAAGIPVSDYVRGVVDYQAGRDDGARAALSRAAASSVSAAEATYYLGALDERAGNVVAAIDEYRRTQRLNPSSPLAADALWWAGRLLEGRGKFDEAAESYEMIVSSYPQSEWFSEADFRRGLVAFRKGDAASAAGIWAAVAQHTSAEDNLRARFWQARALTARNQSSGADMLRQLESDAPGSFYALRAEVLLRQHDAKSRAPKLKDDAPDWKKISRYIQDQAGVDPETVDDALSSDPRWARGAELATVELSAQSDTVYRSIISEYDGDPRALYRITKRFADEGRTSLAARAATRVIDAVASRTAPPDDLLRIAYPVVYPDLVQDAASEQSVSPTLLLALVRQESFYDPDAGSTAGALGLTQVVPSTGQSIAARLGITSFRPEELYRPNVSLRFGAQYLATQLKSFGGDSYRALAAYNGGPGAVSKAASKAGGDDDLFVEDLEFSETKTYVKRVMENYARYRWLYEKTDRPSLPR